MRQTFSIPGRMPSLNEFYRLDRYEQNRVKRCCDELVAWSAKEAGIRPYDVPIRYHILWLEQNRRRDLDNIAFAKKFVQDGLVKARIIRNDTRHEIAGFSDSFGYDPMNPRIIVTLEESQHG